MSTGSTTWSVGRVLATAAVVATALTILTRPAPAAVEPVRDQWQPLGGVITSAPDLAELSDGSIHYFARGQDGAVWTLVVDGDGQSTGWSSLGGQAKGGPGAATTRTGPTGSMHLFVRGLDDALWYREYSVYRSMWWDWRRLGGVLTSDPSVMAFDDGSLGSNELQVFGRGSDNALWNLRGVEGQWTSLGGILVGGPGAGLGAGGSFGTVAVRGQDDASWYREYSSETGRYGPWTSAGGILTDDPDATTLCVGPDIWARGGDGSIYHSSGDGWHPLGGRSRSGPGVHATATPSDWVVAVRGLDDGLWALRHRWLPRGTSCSTQAPPTTTTRVARTRTGSG